MTDSSGQGFGGAEAAWEDFRSRLEQRLHELGDGEIVLVEAMSADQDDDGAAPYVQVVAYGEGDDEPVLRCEAVSNEYLKDALQLDAAQQRQMEEIGFRAPTPSDDDGGSLNYFSDCDQTAAGYTAELAVRALREVYGIAHPAFLVPDEDLVPAAPVGSTPTVAPHVSAEIAAVANPDELKAALDAALTPYLGHAPHYDEDGDIRIDTEHGCFYIRIDPHVAVIDLFGRVAVDVTDRRRGLHEINTLTQEQPFLQFALRGTSVMTHLRVDCDPFVPTLVVDHVAHMAHGYDQAVQSLEQRLADLPSVADDERRRARVAAFRVVKELVAAEISEGWDHEVTPDVVAAACDHDDQLVVDLLHHTQRQLTSCRRKRHQEPHMRSLIRDEARLRLQRRLLREALLLLVSSQADLAAPRVADLDSRRAG